MKQNYEGTLKAIADLGYKNPKKHIIENGECWDNEELGKEVTIFYDASTGTPYIFCQNIITEFEKRSNRNGFITQQGMGMTPKEIYWFMMRMVDLYPQAFEFIKFIERSK